MNSTLSEEELHATYVAFEANDRNQSATAKQLGIARSSLQNRLEQYTSRGLGPHFRNCHGVPTGLSVRGTSTLVRGNDGEVKLQWIKTGSNYTLDNAISVIKEAFGEYNPRSYAEKFTALEKLKDVNLHTVYPVADLHFGMYSWREETGDDYDTDIAARTLTNAFTTLLGRVPSSRVGIVLNLGDYFHSDSDEQLTRRSGNKLDVDTRWARVQRDGISLLRSIIDMAKSKHELVLVRNVQGNHDPYGTLALTNALAVCFEKDRQVIVDDKADPVWVHRFGRVLLAATHGDMLKAQDLPANIAANHGVEWGASSWRYGYLGHWHQKRLYKGQDAGEGGGMEVEVFRTIAPKDAWGTQMGHTARRSLVAITHHHIQGEVDRQTVNIETRRTNEQGLS